MIRTTGGRPGAHPQRGGFRLVVAAAALGLGTRAARAGIVATAPLESYIDAFAALNGGEIAALALTLGVVLFAAGWQNLHGHITLNAFAGFLTALLLAQQPLLHMLPPLEKVMVTE